MSADRQIYKHLPKVETIATYLNGYAKKTLIFLKATLRSGRHAKSLQLQAAGLSDPAANAFPWNSSS